MSDLWLFNLLTLTATKLLKRKTQKYLYEKVNHHKVN